MASEIFLCDIPSIYQHIFVEDENLLEYFFSFLNSKYINDTSAGYFEKAFNSIFNKRPKDVVEFILGPKNIFENLINHISSNHVKDIVMKILSLECTKCDPTSNECFVALSLIKPKKISAIERLLINVISSDDYFEAKNSTEVICEILNRYSLIHDGKDMLDEIMKIENIIILLDKLESTEEDHTCCYIIMILNQLLNFYVPLDQDAINQFSFLLRDQEDESDCFASLKLNYDNVEFVKTLNSRLPSIFTIFRRNLKTNEDGVVEIIEENRMGPVKYRLLLFFDTLFNVEATSVWETMIKANILNEILELFQIYFKHNIYQNGVVSMIIKILKKNNKEIIEHLFRDIKILDFIQRNFDPDELPELSGQLQTLINFIRSRIPVDLLSSQWSEFLNTKVENHLTKWRKEIGATIKTREDFNPFIPRLPHEKTLNTRDSLVMLNESPQKKVIPADEDDDIIEEENQENNVENKEQNNVEPGNELEGIDYPEEDSSSNLVEENLRKMMEQYGEKPEVKEDDLKNNPTKTEEISNSPSSSNKKPIDQASPKSDENIFESKNIPPKKNSVEIIDKSSDSNDDGSSEEKENKSYDVSTLRKKVRFIRRRQNPETGSLNSEYSEEDSNDSNRLSRSMGSADWAKAMGTRKISQKEKDLFISLGLIKAKKI